MRNFSLQITVFFLIAINLGANSFSKTTPTVINYPSECKAYIQGLQSGKINATDELSSSYTLPLAASATALLGWAGLAPLSYVALGGSLAAGSLIAAVGWVPIIGWATAGVAGSYLLYKAFKEHQKMNCMEFSTHLNFSIKENRDPRINATTQQKIGRSIEHPATVNKPSDKARTAQ